jgi:methionyl-tRNA synthetase
MLDWENAGKSKLLSPGYSLREPQLLFRKIEDAEIEEQVRKLRAGSLAKPATPPDAGTHPSEAPAATPIPEAKPGIVFDDFAKIDLRIGTVRHAEKLPKADKLLRLEVDMGGETRTIVSGIALHFAPEEVLGRQVVVVANLAPRKMRGVESHGMILMADDGQGGLRFISPDSEVPPGSSVS